MDPDQIAALAFANRTDPDQAELPGQGLLCLLIEI